MGFLDDELDEGMKATNAYMKAHNCTWEEAREAVINGPNPPAVLAVAKPTRVPLAEIVESLQRSSERATAMLAQSVWYPRRAHVEGLRNTLEAAATSLVEYSKRGADLSQFEQHPGDHMNLLKAMTQVCTIDQIAKITAMVIEARK